MLNPHYHVFRIALLLFDNSPTGPKHVEDSINKSAFCYFLICVIIRMYFLVICDLDFSLRGTNVPSTVLHPSGHKELELLKYLILFFELLVSLVTKDVQLIR
jgi:hypothetical protein